MGLLDPKGQFVGPNALVGADYATYYGYTRRFNIIDDGAVTYFNNTEVNIGASFIVGGQVPRDSDSDGVIDGVDKCPGTPIG